MLNVYFYTSTSRHLLISKYLSIWNYGPKRLYQIAAQISFVKSEDHARYSTLGLYSSHRNGCRYQNTHAHSLNIMQHMLLVTNYLISSLPIKQFSTRKTTQAIFQSQHWSQSQRSNDNIYIRSQNVFSCSRNLYTQKTSSALFPPYIPNILQ